MSEYDPLEKVWGDILSRDVDLVVSAFDKLDTETRLNVFQHLKAMTNEKGWHKEQRISARFALKTIQNKFPKVFDL